MSDYYDQCHVWKQSYYSDHDFYQYPPPCTYPGGYGSYHDFSATTSYGSGLVTDEDDLQLSDDDSVYAAEPAENQTLEIMAQVGNFLTTD